MATLSAFADEIAPDLKTQMDVCEANGIKDGYVRPVAWRGSEMMGVSAQHNT
ncbi:hypothetical protein LCGC14_1537650, partial [marine sediment metagenome]